MLEFLRDTLVMAAEKNFGKPCKNKKRTCQLPPSIVKLLRRKKEITFDFVKQRTPLPNEVNTELDALNRQIQDSISGFRIRKRNRFRSKALQDDPTRRKFWRFLRSQSKQSGVITALYKSKQVKT